MATKITLYFEIRELMFCFCQSMFGGVCRKVLSINQICDMGGAGRIRFVCVELIVFQKVLENIIGLARKKHGKGSKSREIGEKKWWELL